MALSLLFFVLISLSTINLSNSELTENYYETTCPNFEKIMTDIITAKQQAEPRTMASAFRLLFHDCMVDGCDASIMLNSTGSAEEKEITMKFNRLLSMEGFDIVHVLKEALEKECPGVVSCADILAYSTRNLVELAGGPHFRVPLGRKDGRVSLSSHVEGNLPAGDAPMDEMIRQFTQYGMTMEDLTALTIAGHSTGTVHCKSFGGSIGDHPLVDPQYAQIVGEQCNNSPSLTRIQLDEVTPYKLDNVYCEQMKKNRLVFRSDELFVSDPRTRVLIDAWSKDEKAFFDAFVKGMERMVMIGIKDETNGEVRTRCYAVNSNPNDISITASI